MFALQMHSVPRVTSWDDAVATLNRARNRKERNGAYPLPGKENNRDVSVRMSEKGIHFRYHLTDVITWHPDGSYTYDPWTSRSTCTFFNQFCPVDTHLTRDGKVLIIGDVGYPIGGGSEVHVVDGVPQTGLGVFQREVVNRAKAKAVLERTRYAEYREWHKVMSPLLSATERQFWSGREIVDALQDETNWPVMASNAWGDYHPDKVRLLIYADYQKECYEMETSTSLPALLATRNAYRVMPSA